MNQRQFWNFRFVWNGPTVQNQPDYRELHIICDFIDLSLKQEFRLFSKMNIFHKKETELTSFRNISKSNWNTSKLNLIIAAHCHADH